MKNFLDGSDIAGIIGLNPDKTPYSVWHSIVHPLGEGDEIETEKISAKLAPAIASLYEDASGKKTIIPLEKKICHPEYKFLAGNPVRFVEDDGILETYLSDSKIGLEFLPQHWYLKLIFDMGITKKQRGSAAWLENGLKFSFTDIEFDEELYTLMIAEAVDFFIYFVLTKNPPDKMALDYLNEREVKQSSLCE